MRARNTVRARQAGPNLPVATPGPRPTQPDLIHPRHAQAGKVTQLAGHAAAEAHRRLSHAMVALCAFTRRRAGRLGVAAANTSTGGDHAHGVGVVSKAKVSVPELSPAPTSEPTTRAALEGSLASKLAHKTRITSPESASVEEENTLVEALRQVHGVLMAEDKAEVERVAAGVGLAPALLELLRALRSEIKVSGQRGGDGGGGSESGWRLAKHVSGSERYHFEHALY